MHLFTTGSAMALQENRMKSRAVPVVSASNLRILLGHFMSFLGHASRGGLDEVLMPTWTCYDLL